MSTRYKVEGNWSEVHRAQVFVSSPEPRDLEVYVIREVSDLIDTRTAHTYRDGAHRVRVLGPVTPRPRTRTFKGETAWSDAERCAADLLISMRRARL